MIPTRQQLDDAACAACVDHPGVDPCGGPCRLCLHRGKAALTRFSFLPDGAVVAMDHVLDMVADVKVVG